MNPSLLLHLIRKDIRAFRWPLFLLWGTLVVLALLPIMPENAQLSRQLFLVAWILLCLVQSQALQLDPAASTTHFLKTRPVSVGILLLSKWALLILAGLLPILLTGFIQIQRIGLGLVLLDYVWLATQGTVLFVFFTGLLMPLAVYTRKVLHLIGACIITFFLLVLLGLLLMKKPEQWDSMVEGLVYSVGYGGFVGLLLMGCAAHFLAAGHYFKWKLRWQMLTAIGGVAVTALSLHFWTSGPITFHDPEVKPDKEVKEALKTVRLEYQPSSHLGWSGGGYPGRLDAIFKIHNLPDPYYLRCDGWSSTARLPDGQTFYSSLPFPHADRHVRPDKAATLLGLPANPPIGWEEIGTETTVNSSLFSNYACFAPGVEWGPLVPRVVMPKSALSDLPKSTVSGVCRYQVLRASLSAEIPLLQGTVYNARGFHVGVVRIAEGSDPITFRTVSFPWTQWRSSYVVHQSRQEIFNTYAGGLGNSLFCPAGFSVKTSGVHQKYSSGKPIELPPVSSWAIEGRLCLFEVQAVTEFSWPFELKDIPIRNGR